MSDAIATGGEQPQPAAPTPAPETPPQATPPAPEPPKPEELTPPAPETPKPEPDKDSKPAPTDLLSKVDITKLTDAQLDEFTSGDQTRIQAVLDELGIKDDTPPPAPKAPEPPAPKADAIQQPQPQADKELNRISLKAVKNPEDRLKLAEAVQLVRDGKFETMSDALASVFKIAPKAADPQPGEQQPEPAQPAAQSDEITQLEEQIDALNAEIEKAAEEYDYKTERTKSRELTKLEVRLAVAKEKAEREAAAKQTQDAGWKQAEEASRARVMDRFGEQMTDPSSEFADYVEAEIILAERKNDTILQTPDWPEKIAERVNSKYFGGKPAAHSPVDEPDEPTIPAPPPKGVRMPGTPLGSQSQPVAMSVQDALAQLDRLPEEQRLEVLAMAEKLSSQTRR